MSFRQSFRQLKHQSSPDRGADRSVSYSNSTSNSPPSSSSELRDLPRLGSFSNSYSASTTDSPYIRHSSIDSDDPASTMEWGNDTSPNLVGASTFHSHRSSKRSTSGSSGSTPVSMPRRRRSSSTGDQAGVPVRLRKNHTVPTTISGDRAVAGAKSGTARQLLASNGHIAKPKGEKRHKKPIPVQELTYKPTDKFDNEQGDLIFAEEDLFHDEDNKRRYKVMGKIGSGTFGQVVKVEMIEGEDDSSDAFHTATEDSDNPGKRFYAIKIIKNKEAYHAQALKETTILQRLNERWDPDGTHNIVRLLSVFYAKGHLMLVFPILGWNLYELLRAHHHRGFKTSVVQVFIVQVTSALICLANAGIVHTDLKPENILLESENRWQIKVIDFGSASYENHNASTYIQSRFYRAPEVILGVGYNRAIDMWSLGCIAAELYLGLPLFPGKNEFNQLRRITKVLKDIPQQILSRGNRTNLFYYQHAETGEYVMKSAEQWAEENNTQPVGMTEYFPGESLEEIIMQRNLSPATDTRVVRQEHQERILLVQFIRECLAFDFTRRMNPQQANNHQFLARVPSLFATNRRASATKPAVSATPTATVTGVANPSASQVPLVPMVRGDVGLVPQHYKMYNQQMAVPTLRQQPMTRRYQYPPQMRPPPIYANHVTAQQDVNAIIAARKQKPAPRWRNKSYDVGQHMRAEEQAKRRLEAQAQAQAQQARLHGRQPMMQTQLGQHTVSATPTSLHYSRSAHTTPTSPLRPRGLRRRHSSTSLNDESEMPRRMDIPRRTVSERRSTDDDSVEEHLIRRIVQNRTNKNLERRKRYKAVPRATLDENETVTQWSSRSMSDLSSLSQLPRQSSAPSTRRVSSRSRSNTAPDVGALPTISGVSSNHISPQAGPESGMVPGPRPLFRNYSQPVGTSAGVQINDMYSVQPRHHSRRNRHASSAQTSPVGITRNHFAAAAPSGYPPQIMDMTADYYGPYMHEHISMRGQEQIHELGQRSRHLRTFQTPRDRYF